MHLRPCVVHEMCQRHLVGPFPRATLGGNKTVRRVRLGKQRVHARVEGDTPIRKVLECEYRGDRLAQRGNLKPSGVKDRSRGLPRGDTGHLSAHHRVTVASGLQHGERGARDPKFAERVVDLARVHETIHILRRRRARIEMRTSNCLFTGTLFNMPAHATVVERLLSDSSSPPRALLHELPARIPLIYAQVFTHLRSTLSE